MASTVFTVVTKLNKNCRRIFCISEYHTIVFKASVKHRLVGKAHQGVEASGRLSFLSKASRRRCLLTSARCEQRRRQREQGKAPTVTPCCRE
jgi:hypothetical protein